MKRDVWTFELSPIWRMIEIDAAGIHVLRV